MHQDAVRLWKIVARWGWLLALCPFVRMIAVCNSLASGSATQESDIDLFVVAKTGRLSSCRFFMKLFTQAFAIRAHHEKRAGRFCLSFFIDESAMNLQPLALEHDPLLADFVATMEPIHGEKTYREFFAANALWVNSNLGRESEPHTPRIRKHRAASAVRAFTEGLLGLFGDAVERWCDSWLTKREMKYRKKFEDSSGVKIGKHIFKFHEQDPRFILGEPQVPP